MAKTKMSLEAASELLTDAEIEALRAKAREEVLAERKAQAEQAVLAELRAQERRELGVITGDGVKDETVWLVVDLPEFANHILIDGKAFFHGIDYPMPRHQAETVREIMQRALDHQTEVDGKGVMAARRNKVGIIERSSGTALSMKTGMAKAAPARTN